MGPVGLPEMVAIFVIALILFGPKKLPELGRTIGKGLSEFRRAKSELKATFETHLNELEKETRVATTTVPTVVDPSSSRYSYPYDEYGAYESGSSPEIAGSTSVAPVPTLEQPAAESSEPYREPALVTHAVPVTDTVPRASSILEEEHRS